MARNTVYRIKADFVPRGELERRRSATLAREAAERAAEREARRTYLVPWDGRVRLREPPRSPAQAFIEDHIHSPLVRDIARVASHGVARTGTGLLRLIDAPNRLLGLENSPYRRLYEGAEAGLAADRYEMGEAAPQLLETAVHLGTSGGVFGKALPAAFGTEVGLGTYESSRAAGMPVVEALSRGISHGVVDTAIWTAGAGLSSKYLPKAWQQLGHQITGAARGASSSLVSDMVADSANMLSDDVSMGERAVHAAWMVPLLGMLKMGGKRRDEAMSLLRKARPDLAGARADKAIETIEAEFADPKSQKVALAWVARKGANLPDDTAQIKQALEVAGKVKGLDPMSRSPFEIISDPAYARYLPKPRPQDVKAFSNMKRYPMGVVGFDVSDDAAGRQATREMINAYMSPSSNPWCLATGRGASRLGELGPDSEKYWKMHSAVPKQIFFQDVEGDGRLELIAFRATSRGGVGRQEYYDTSDAGYSGIPIKVKVPGDPMGRYRKMVFKPDDPSAISYRESESGRMRALSIRDAREVAQGNSPYRDYMSPADIDSVVSELHRRDSAPKNEVQGTFEDIAPGKVFKGDPFRDGRSQTWVKQPPKSVGLTVGSEREIDQAIQEGIVPEHDRERLLEEYRQRDTGILSLTATDPNMPYVLVEDKVRTTENGITKFRTTKYADPTDWDYEPPKPGEQPKPVEIEESELVSPEWMRARGYDPESEADVRRMQSVLNLRAWGNGAEAAMAAVPTRRTYLQTKSGTPETVTYGPNGRDVVSVDFTEDGVPYRLEYSPHQTGRPDTVFGLLQAGGGASSVPASPEFSPRPGEAPYRLLRNPDSPTPEVLDEIRWDEGLGSYVRTRGNRRWRDDQAADGSALYDRFIDLGRELDSYDAQDLTAPGELLRDYAEARRAWDSWVARNPRYIPENFEGDSLLGEGRPSRNYGQVPAGTIVEDRQPDGTWTPVETFNIQASPSRANTLPPPPDEIPLWSQQGLTEEALREEAEYNEARQRPYGEENERVLPAVPSIPDPWDMEVDDVPFALKAGRTRRNVRAAEGGGDNFALSRNFLATDRVPESIFGIPVVQDESQYTEKDLEFFRRNPKAAGFYDLGDDEEMEEDVPQQAVKSKPSRGAYPGSLNNPGNVEKRKERRQGEVDSPHERWAKFATPQDGLREMADAIRQIAAVKLAEKGQDFTIRNFAEVYAPRVNKEGKKENDTDKYIENLSADSGFGADEELHRWDDGDMARLLKSVVKFESGARHSAWFTDEEYGEAAKKLQEGSFD